jgi:hypothetical protein
VTLLAILFTVVMASPAHFNEDTRALIRAMGKALGCMTPSISATWKPENGNLEVTVRCLKPGEADE